MEIVALNGYTSDRRVFPRPPLFTVWDDNVTLKKFIQISNHEGEEDVSPFIGAPSLHLDQSGGVSGTSPPLLLMPENMKSPHVYYESRIFFSGHELDLVDSTHQGSWYQDTGNFNSSMVKNTG